MKTLENVIEEILRERILFIGNVDECGPKREGNVDNRPACTFLGTPQNIIDDLTSAVNEYALKEIKFLLDELRPIRQEQEQRILFVKGQVQSNRPYTAIDKIDLFLSEMQKAKAIHAKIDNLINKEYENT